MNFSRTNRPGRIVLIAAAIFTILAATACGGKAKKADRAPTQKRVLQSQAPSPTTEVLKDSPCGNPDWAKPPGSAGEEAVDAEFRTTSRKKSAPRQTDSKPDQSEQELDDQNQIGESPEDPLESND